MLIWCWSNVCDTGPTINQIGSTSVFDTFFSPGIKVCRSETIVLRTIKGTSPGLKSEKNKSVILFWFLNMTL